LRAPSDSRRSLDCCRLLRGSALLQKPGIPNPPVLTLQNRVGSRNRSFPFGLFLPVILAQIRGSASFESSQTAVGSRLKIQLSRSRVVGSSNPGSVRIVRNSKRTRRPNPKKPASRNFCVKRASGRETPLCEPASIILGRDFHSSAKVYLRFMRECRTLRP